MSFQEQILYTAMLRASRSIEKGLARKVHGITKNGVINPRAFPPRRLTFICETDKCDICDQNTYTKTKTVFSRDGWLCCDDCYKKTLILTDFWFRSKTDIVTLLGSEIVKVRRSSGEIDDGWIVCDGIFYNCKHDDFIVPLTKSVDQRFMNKDVPLKTLISINLGEIKN